MREMQQVVDHYRKLVRESSESEEEASETETEMEKYKTEPFLVLGGDLRGFFNKSNPFRSQLISTERTQLLSSLVKPEKNTSQLSVGGTTRNICINNFTIISDSGRSSRNWSELVKNSFERNTLKFAKRLTRTARTGSHVSFSKQFSKTIHQSDYIASKFLQHVMKKKSSSKENFLERKTLQGLNKILKKTRTPILNFIDCKNFVIAGSDYLRVYHFSEQLW